MRTAPSFERFDFKKLKSPDFKEDSVREVLVLPILYALGYTDSDIIRSKPLKHPFIKVGSKKRPINLIPDYVIKVEDNFAWVLDAKAPGEQIMTGDNVDQVFSYAIHPEVRARFFGLCNGKEFVLFRQDYEKPVLNFELSEIGYHWEKIVALLGPTAFQKGKQVVYEAQSSGGSEREFDYLNRPLLEEISVEKQSAKRHFGVHGYFTKQSWNVVHEYIRNFTRPGDMVLDPFGGTGVTLVEALVLKRRAIHIDLNPMSVFIVNALLVPVSVNRLQKAYEEVMSEFTKLCPSTKDGVRRALRKYAYPKGIPLPKGSDVATIEELFSEEQLAQLALLKHLILRQKEGPVKETLLLMFSGLLNKINLTYHASKGRTEGRGNSSVFAYYRYRLAKKPASISISTYFESRLKKVVAAKNDVSSKISYEAINGAKILKGTATDLKFLKDESIDYIYTDPPYGKKIPYLDLSVMWNAWLDLKVTAEDYELEAIEGGEHDKTKEDYSKLISKSIQEMYRVLKFDRWLTFVFAHKDPEFWHLIVDTAERAGFEYAGAVKQSNGQTSFKKRQNPFTVLSGQLIINFKKVRNPRSILKANLGMNIAEIVMQTIEGVIAKHHGATLEQINNELIIKGLELGFLDLLKKEYSDLTLVLMDNFDFDEKAHLFRIRKNTKFKTHLDVRLRIRYYLISFLRRMEIEKKMPSFDEIVLYVMPLLRNGKTPENQTILSVLEDIAEKAGVDSWRLKESGQTSLFF